MAKKILSVFGTRPEAIKMAPVVQQLASSCTIESYIAVTAQHRDMLDQVLKLFELNPDFDLNVMRPDQNLFDITAKALLGLREIYQQCQPDLVLVHGDTTTCFTAALAAFYSNIPVGHVEAGLRTGNIKAPFPEEANRSMVSRISRLNFAPTETAKQNLIAENIAEEQIWVTGNTVIDALLSIQQRLPDYDPHQWQPKLPLETINAIHAKPDKIILVTGHRRENFGQGFIDFCQALKILAIEHPGWLIIYPVHLNPNVQRPVYERLKKQRNIHLIVPQEYLPFIWLLDNCDLVISDSGGIQEEAPSLGKPVLVTRKVTERPEAVTAGTVRLVGTQTETIVNNAVDILTDSAVYARMSNAHNPYGDGQAASRIEQIILNYLCRSSQPICNCNEFYT